MLYTITARLLINVDDETWPEHQKAVVTDGLNELFREVADPNFVKDWAFDPDPINPNERHIVARPDLLESTYLEGDFLITS